MLIYLKVFGYMFRQHCGHHQANLNRLSAFKALKALNLYRLAWRWPQCPKHLNVLALTIVYFIIVVSDVKYIHLYCHTTGWFPSKWKNIGWGVFEKRVLRKIFGPEVDEVRGDYRNLHGKELHDLYSSPNITQLIKSWRMRWAGHVARMGRR